MTPRPYLALVPGLCLLSAAGCDLLVLGFDLSYNLLHVQAATVVHLHHHRGVFDAGLQLTQLLVEQTKQKHRIYLKQHRGSFWETLKTNEHVGDS